MYVRTVSGHNGGQDYRFTSNPLTWPYHLPSISNLLTRRCSFAFSPAVQMVFSVATLLVVGKYLEPFWGTREFVKFVLLVNVWAALGCVIWTVLSYLLRISSSYAIFPDVAYGGFGGVISGFAVAGKQLVPEFETPVFGFIPARMRHMPLLLLLSNFMWHLLGIPASSYSFVVTGTLTAWIYLRYFQQRPGLPTAADGSSAAVVRGDRSDATSFLGFFPETIQPTLSKIFCLSRAPAAAPPVTRSDFIKNGPAAPHSADPAIPVNLEAERRRLAALQQVDARIAKMKAKSTASLPGTPIAAK